MTEFGPDAPPDPPRLTREMLLDGGLSELIARVTPDVRVLTDAERRASLLAALAERPEHGDGIWLFAYGSLLWNPTIHVGERRVAEVRGWHRAFCLGTRAGRGSADNPGLLLGLRAGGFCAGAALRVAEQGLEHELDVLWRREMVTAGYVPRWLAVCDPDGTPFGHALAFTIGPDCHGYEGDLSEADMVRRLATAAGALGSSAEYLFRTLQGLRGLGVEDPLVERLAARVRARLTANDAGESPVPDPDS
jgi:glutathione-specific gamma-glutamylcyclotransferase